MIELRVLALVGLILTGIAAWLAVTALCALGSRIRHEVRRLRARRASRTPESPRERQLVGTTPCLSAHPASPTFSATPERLVRRRQATWRLRC